MLNLSKGNTYAATKTKSPSMRNKAFACDHLRRLTPVVTMGLTPTSHRPVYQNAGRRGQKSSCQRHGFFLHKERPFHQGTW